MPIYAADPAEDARLLNEQAMRATRENDYEKAIRLFESALVFQPGEPDIESNLAIAINNYALSLKDSNLDRAVSILEDACRQFPKESKLKDNLAYLYNARAVNMYEAGRHDEALQDLDRARRLAPQDTVLASNMAEVFVKEGAKLINERGYRAAEKYLKKAYDIKPDNVNAHYLLGEIYYNQQKMKEAKAEWESVKAMAPDYQGIDEKLEKLEKEIKVEGSLVKTAVSNFDIRYERNAEEYDIYDVRNILFEARSIIGRDFGVYPKYKVIVILYPEDDFNKIRNLPLWLAGLYDGKIRIPLNKDISREMLEGIIFHEYTHVIIQELAKGKCPIWLNEGLARYEEFQGREYAFPSLAQAKSQGTLLDFNAFSGAQIDFSLSSDAVALFYDQSYSFVKFLADRFRIYKLKKLCLDLGEGTVLEEALKKEFRMKLEDLVASWKKSLTLQF